MLIFPRKLGLELVEIRVGLEQRRYRVHKNLLCSRIKHFRKIFDTLDINFCRQLLAAEVNDAHFQTILQQEEDPDAFGLFIEWLYTNRLEPPTEPLSESEKIYVKLCGFAELIGEHELADCAMTNLLSIYRSADKLPDLGIIRLAYENTMGESKLRELMSDVLLWVSTHPEYRHNYPPGNLCQVIGSAALAYDFFEKLGELSGNPMDPRRVFKPTQRLNCHYHWHGVEVQCA